MDGQRAFPASSATPLAVEIVVLLGDTLVSVTYFEQRGCTLGTAADVDIHCAGSWGARYRVLLWDQNGPRIRVPPGARLLAPNGAAIAQWEAPVPKRSAPYLRVVSGPFTLLARRAPHPRLRPALLRPKANTRGAGYVLASAAMHVFTVVLLSVLPPGARALALSNQTELGDDALIWRSSPEKPRRRPTKYSGDLRTAPLPPIAPGMVPMRGGENQTRSNVLPRRNHMQPNSRADAVRLARAGGILGHIPTGQWAAWSQVSAHTVGSQTGWGLDPREAGSRGWGSRETGQVEGDSSTKTPPGFGYITARTGFRHGAARAHLRTRTGRPAPLVTTCRVIQCPSQTGSPVVRRYVRKKLPRIQHCYERELLAKPDLRGTVTTRFTIAPNGRVLGVTAKGAGHGTLHRCIEAVIASIQFPKTHDKTLSAVTYPFHLSVAGR